MPDIISTLGYDFDSEKYGNAIVITEKVNNYLTLTKDNNLKDWQKDELANTIIIRTDYYENPLIDIINEFSDSLNVFYSNISSISEFDSPSVALLLSNVNLILSELSANQIYEFQRHTSNISGVTKSVPSTSGEDFSNYVDYPDYEKGIQVGQDIIRIVNSVNEVQNLELILGSFTSLFISDDLTDLSINMQNIAESINSTIRIETIENPNTDPNAPETIDVTYSNVDFTTANAIYLYANTANNLIWNRRLHDQNYYRASLQKIQHYNNIKKLNNLGIVEKYLVNNLIGTDSYKEKLAANT